MPEVTPVERVTREQPPAPASFDCREFVKRCVNAGWVAEDNTAAKEYLRSKVIPSFTAELATAFADRAAPADVRAAAERLRKCSEFGGDTPAYVLFSDGEEYRNTLATVAREFLSAPRPATEADGRAGDDGEPVTFEEVKSAIGAALGGKHDGIVYKANSGELSVLGLGLPANTRGQLNRILAALGIDRA